jgi:hypothetical protein
MSIISPVLEVMVRRHRGVVDAALGIRVDLPGEALPHEQVERVVDGRLRHVAARGAQRGEDLLGGEVPRRGEQDLRDPEALGGGPDAALLEDLACAGRGHLHGRCGG